jgi:hypothetical protein
MEDDVYEHPGLRTPRPTTGAGADLQLQKVSLGPSVWWLIGYFFGWKNLAMLCATTVTIPRFLWDHLGGLGPKLLFLPGAKWFLLQGTWYLPVAIGGFCLYRIIKNVIIYKTEHYEYDPRSTEIVCISFRDRGENSVSLSLVHDVDIVKPSLLNYGTDTGHLVIKYSTPENKGARVYLFWVKHPRKIRDFIKSKSGVSKARFVVTV